MATKKNNNPNSMRQMQNTILEQNKTKRGKTKMNQNKQQYRQNDYTEVKHTVSWTPEQWQDYQYNKTKNDFRNKTISFVLLTGILTTWITWFMISSKTAYGVM